MRAEQAPEREVVVAGPAHPTAAMVKIETPQHGVPRVIVYLCAVIMFINYADRESSMLRCLSHTPICLSLFLSLDLLHHLSRIARRQHLRRRDWHARRVRMEPHHTRPHPRKLLLWILHQPSPRVSLHHPPQHHTSLTLLSSVLAYAFGAREVLAVAALGWSVLTLLTPSAAGAGVGAMVVCRICLGLFEGMCFPCVFAILSASRPERRSSNISLQIASTYFGMQQM